MLIVGTDRNCEMKGSLWVKAVSVYGMIIRIKSIHRDAPNNTYFLFVLLDAILVKLVQPAESIFLNLDVLVTGW